MLTGNSRPILRLTESSLRTLALTKSSLADSLASDSDADEEFIMDSHHIAKVFITCTHRWDPGWL